ncbi:hypothetical protein BASA50_001005 [Batrachochytrium salamandrivorans]|uniref:Uncharacterized protein n=1 Tax=Batrachochytrium salamandrivorans TaxID=1357716 RepID=A0ABQ8ESD6_9FUNG|nr:hypothetical protein BASA50_001005 [Batrachochytrium salamandrivorans]KAH6592576.1 hypothetical protein BASA61_004512 [Batrachochytrium salamandrivorans]KAH9273999.1 hypothetical protein BASA83_003634 [Batrachochytrium salamandrivorans]
MQFFHLLSFVGVASTAAALSQSAGLSEQYLDNADNSLEPDLETRPYQPGLDSQKTSATLMSLEQQDGAAGLLGGKSGFGTAPLSELSRGEAKKLIDSLFEKDAFSFANVSSTIDEVKNGLAELSENGEKVKTKIVGDAGNLMANYVRRSTYVSVSLTISASSELNATVFFIKSIEAPDDSSKVFLGFIGMFIGLMAGATKKEKEADGFIMNILEDTGTVIQNVEAAIKSFVEAVNSLVKLFDLLKTIMSKSESGKTSYDDISTTIESIGEFITDQQKLHDEIITALEDESSE